MMVGHLTQIRACFGGDIRITLWRGYNGLEVVTVERSPSRGTNTTRTLLSKTEHPNFSGNAVFEKYIKHLDCRRM